MIHKVISFILKNLEHESSIADDLCFYFPDIERERGYRSRNAGKERHYKQKIFTALASATMTFTASGSIAVLADDFVIESISFFLVSIFCFSNNIFSNY